MNRLDPAIVERVRLDVEAGLSIRQISRKYNIGKGTANSYQKQFIAGAPPCLHGLKIKDCSSCRGQRRVVTSDGGLKFIKPGPRSKRNPTGPIFSGSGILLMACAEILAETD